jgi:hypothetical protein
VRSHRIEDTGRWDLLRRLASTGGPRIDYEDFIVQVGPERDGEVHLRVLQSPAGQGGGSFSPPWTPGEWAGLRAGLGRDVGPAGGEAPAAPLRIGGALFFALFSGQVGTLWARSLGVTPDRGLRLQLRFQLESEPRGAAFLHSLPWELLYQPDTRDFLALSRLTPVVRYLEVARPASVLPLPSILRILVVIAEPPRLAPLDLARERREIEAAWGGSPRVEVQFLEEPTAEALRGALLASPFHVLHFMGHGGLDSSTGEGLLFFAAPGDAFDPRSGEVSGEALATLLKDFKTLRLVVLNACKTGRALGGEGLDPFAGVATALVMAGLPAVVAMQLPISDLAAIAFSRTLHLRLAAGDPVDAAVTEGRQAVYTASPGTLEWAIPVLFTRVSDGRIFDRLGRRATDSSSPMPPAAALLRGQPRRSPRVLGLAAGLIGLALLLSAVLGGFPKLSWPAGGSSSQPALDRVRVGQIWISRYEVAQRDFLRFVLANQQWRRGEIPAALHDGDYLRNWMSWHEFPSGLANHPVTWVSWYAAKAFCEWMGGRLPTQKEWQRAAHTAEGRYPWGEALVLGNSPPLNFCDAACTEPQRDGASLPGFRDGYPETAPVDAFPGGQTREGVFNLSGNVWEWCDDASGTKRVTLGGSYLSTLIECTTDKPSPEDAQLCATDGGFRCVWE